MTRKKKLLLVAAILLIVVAAGLATLIMLLPESDLIRAGVEEKLRDSTGRDVTIGSLKVSVSFPSLITLTVQGISVPSARGKSLLSADRLVLVPSLASLFSRSVAIESITVQGMRLSIRRSPEGELEDFARAGGRLGVERKTEPAEPSGRTPAPSQPPADAGPAPVETRTRGIHWTVRTVTVADGRVDWIDRQAGGGEEAVVSLKDINGSIREGSDNSRSLAFKAILGDDRQEAGTVGVEGIIEPSPDFSQLERADLNIRVSAASLKPLHVYLPPWARFGEQFSSGQIQTRLVVEQGRPAKVSFKGDMKGGASEASQLKVSGTVTAAEDLSAIEEITASCETDGLPLRIFKTLLPAGFPLDADHGTVKAGLQGEWQRGPTWHVGGSIGLENAVPAGKLRAIAPRVRVWALGAVDPDKLSLDNLEIVDGAPLATVSGTVSQPLSRRPTLDLKGEIEIRPDWPRALGLEAPQALTVSRPVPLRGRITGKLSDLWIDLTGDVTSTGITFAPYIEKSAGNKGAVYVRGRFSPGDRQANKDSGARITVGTALSGARVRLLKDGPRLAGCAVRFDAKIIHEGNKTDLEDAKLVLRRGAEVADRLTSRVNITDLGSKAPKIDGTVTVAFDKTLIDLLDLRFPAGVGVSGSAPLKAKFSGASDELEWAAELPLTPLDLAVEGAFQKRAGVSGEIKASGKWTEESVILTEGRITLPGLVAVGRGLLKNREGRPGGLSVDVTKADLKELSALVPASGGLGLSGPVEASFRIRNTRQGTAHSGTVRLLGVNCRPRDAGWGLEKLKGSIETTGAGVTMPEVTGRIAGAVQAPLKVWGSVNNAVSLESATGRVSIEMGPGRLMLERIRPLLSQAQVLVGTLLNPRSGSKAGNLLDFQSLAGTFDIRSGAVRTENLKLKGSDLSMGAIGAMQLKSRELDALSALHTVTVIPAAIGQIPAVQQVVKKHEELLKATGLDKELKKLGIGVPDSDEDKSSSQPAIRTPVTVIMKIQGPAAHPRMLPVLESALAPGTVSRLKSLIN